MKPVDQTIYGWPNGNCLSACVASILEMPTEAVPLSGNGEDWWPRLLGWLVDRGLSATKIEGRSPPRGYAIAFGPSPRLPGQGHTCVAYDGAVVHDPHPSRAGILGVEHYVVVHGDSGEPLWFNGL